MILPPEIIDVIIDHLQDRAALCKCSLISRIWLPGCRYHIFGAITLRRSNIRVFLTLRTPLCTFARYVQRFELNCILWDFINIPALGERTVQAEQITLYFGGFPSVKELDIDTFSWDSLDSDSQTNFLTCFSTIETLNIRALYVASILSVIRIIGASPLLQSLSLCNVGWNFTDESLYAINKLSPPPHLRTLSLAECYKRDILDWLIHESEPSVESLSLGVIFSADVQSISNYLRRDGPFIEHLSFGFSDMDAGGDAEEFHTEVDLSLLTSLRYIRIEQFIFMDHFQLSSAVGWYPLILARIKSPYLEEVEFSIHISQMDQLDPPDFPIDWKSYDHLFAQGAGFKQLQRLTFLVFSKVDNGVMRNEIGKRLPESDARGILRVKFYV
ncbi:hypothetical protein PILCRDRAFT_821072 [Piloderma croceum F 1598]|uniref:F-box domain-containing protein n=1 Tax=Piloderma croceum (strain F 1598) TaxID=765440 RepID=A0A0C3B657_PILCF|nr:hypothetical protein PILCRDRAFT_821072 [Piloderma croceum F 1598]